MDQIKSAHSISKNSHQTNRHQTAYLSSGPSDGPLLFFIHGWPEHSLVWRAQLEYFGQNGWRCIAPDMRGYGGSAVPDRVDAYQVAEIVLDMLELHDALGGKPAVWIGHDSGCRVVWSMASHHANRCKAVISMCIPYIARGIVLQNLVPLVDRKLYPENEYPLGQWDYFQYYKESFTQAANDFETDVAATLGLLYRRGIPEAASKPAPTAKVRANGGWFGVSRKAPVMPRDESMLSEEDFDFMVSDYQKTGFKGTCSSYINDDANLRFAAGAPNFGQISLPVLFIHAAYDPVCNTLNSRLADPMRMDCSDLTEVIINAGHEVQIEQPAQVNAEIHNWLKSKKSKISHKI